MHMPKSPMSVSAKLDLMLDQQAQIMDGAGGPWADTCATLHEVKRRQEDHIAANEAAHSEFGDTVGALDVLITGNGGVGLAEEVRILQRGYRAILWLGGIAASAVVIQTAIALREHFFQ